MSTDDRHDATLQARGADDEDIAALGPWFHNLHLPDGRCTAPDHPLGDFPARMWERIAPHVPGDLEGWSALDVGCNAGFYSLELAQRGARVLAIDSDEHYLRQARWACERFGLSERIELRRMHVHALARHAQRFDLVWFTGVLYHLRHPLLALDLLRERTKRLLVFQTLTVPSPPQAHAPPENVELARKEELLAAGWPRMCFVEHRLAGDPTNWWVPDTACVAALLRSSGFEVRAHPGEEIWICEPGSSGSEFVDQLRRRELEAVFGLPSNGEIE